MTAIRRLVVFALLAVWSFPAVSLAKSEPETRPLPAVVTATAATRGSAAEQIAEAASLAQREQQSQQAQDFRGGDGVYIYVGSGVLLVAIIVLLLILV